MGNQINSVEAASDSAVSELETSAKRPSSDTKVESFSSMADLQAKAPDVYNQTMFSIASVMIKDMHKHDEHLKQIRREARE